MNEKSLTQHFDDSMSSFSNEKKIKKERKNDDMESSKRCVKLFSLILILRCLTKCNVIRIYNNSV